MAWAADLRTSSQPNWLSRRAEMKDARRTLGGVSTPVGECRLKQRFTKEHQCVRPRAIRIPRRLDGRQEPLFDLRGWSSGELEKGNVLSRHLLVGHARLDGKILWHCEF